MPRRTAANTTDSSSRIPERKKYEKDYLAQVIARIDFAEPLRIPKKGPPRPVVACLKKWFPVPELQVKQLKEVFITLGSEPKETTKEIREWNYHSTSRDKRAVITTTCMLIEYKKYSMFEALREEFLSITDALYARFKDLQVKRLGLRYIDRIELDQPKPTEWSRYLNKNLLSSFKLVPDPTTLIRAFHVVEQKFDDESRLRFQYGMPNPDYPAPIHRKQFVLDTDAYCVLPLTKDEVVQFLDKFHARCVQRFELAITHTLRKQMGPKHD
jgi:uncharacterized protein (TIGR04255 family)